MVENAHARRFIRFGIFELEPLAGELRKGGIKLKLTGQPFQVLTILLERPGQVVTREELRKRLWPDTFVDFEHNLNSAINKIREVLGDSAENPRFVETLPRRGYRFIAPVNGAKAAQRAPVQCEVDAPPHNLRHLAFPMAAVLLAVLGFGIYRWRRAPAPPAQHTLTRVTFDEGLQYQPTWSPDGRYLAYSSDRAGKFDIWVQQVSGGNPVQLTNRPGNNWQPDWSPDGQYIAYRGEAEEGGLYVAPALGGAGLERKISSFGYFPRWSPDSSQILFQTAFRSGLYSTLYVAHPDGSSPQPVQELLTARNMMVSAAWHPDGKRISLWTFRNDGPTMPVFLTAEVNTDRAPVRTEVGPEILQSVADVAGSGISDWADPDFKFSWAPSGEAIYFERTFRGARNLWRMKVDRQTLKAVGLERLTTGTDLNSDLSLSADGRRLAFASQHRKVQAWMFPFDARDGRVTGSGKAVTPAGMEAWGIGLSPDGQRLAFQTIRAGRWELWQKSLPDGSETPLETDGSYVRNDTQWSPDGTRLSYVRVKVAQGDAQIVTRSKDQGEQTVKAPSAYYLVVFDWSRDGKSLLAARVNENHSEIWSLPLSDSDSEAKAHKVIAGDARTDVWQSRYSPNGRWIVFEAEAVKANLHESRIYVTRANGGEWTQITEGKHWDDKPRWSPDGRTIYFLSERKGFFNVWGVRFDPAKGKPQGQPFQVTSFDNPKLMVGDVMPNVGFAVTQDKLVLTMAQLSGSIWMLDDADR